MSKITLKLDESNDLNFQFKVQGTSSEPGATAPVFRFVVFEKARPDGVGYIFPVTSKEENGTITVNIPVLKDTFREGEPYVGKVEVVIGTRLLVPTTMELEFVRSLSVEITPIVSDGAKQEEDDRKTVEELLPEIEALERKDGEEVKVQATEGNKRKITMTKSQLQTLLEKSRNAHRGSTLASVSDPRKNPESSLKTSLKDMMKSALAEEDDNPATSGKK